MVSGLRLLVVGMGAMWVASPASAAPTVECHSINYNYNECSGGSLTKPQLIHQISSNACILNRTWGFNRKSGYLWVAEGCAGVFADVAGYHYGRGDGYDPNARMYNNQGHDVGVAVGGAVVGALISGLIGGNHGAPHETSNYVTNNYGSGRSSGGSTYTGCHGLGCLVGSSSVPELGQRELRSSNDADAPPEPGQTEFRRSTEADAPPEPGQTEFRSSSEPDTPPEPDQQEMSAPQN